MPKIGAFQFSLREGPWAGMSADSHGASMVAELLENCYVAADGSEIRTMPGYVCVIDPETQARKNDGTDTTTGFRATHMTARRPVTQALDLHYFRESDIGGSGVSEELKIYSEPTAIHAVEQIGDRWVFIGEDDFEREPIYNVGHTAWCRVTSASDDGATITVALSDTPDTTANAFNAIDANLAAPVRWRRVWISGLTGALAATLNDKGHVVNAVAGNVLTLATPSTGSAIAAAGPGAIAKVRDIGSAATTPIGDDVESLATWTCIGRGDPESDTPISKVYPAHVFNRQRDFGDNTGNLFEGHQSTALNYHRSRRRQKSLPYRLVPHVTGNRIVLAAPGYGCVFQVPNVVPVNYDESTPSLGLSFTGNDLYDRPRCLGIPKAIAWVDPDPIDRSTFSATSWHLYGASTAQFSFGGSDASVSGRSGSYTFAFAYKDEATGEVGLISEPIKVVTAASTYAFMGLQFLVYFPGYLMHETGALTILCYRSVRNGTQLYFDRSIQIKAPRYSSGPILSSKYGTDPEPHASSSDYWMHAHYLATYQSDADLRKSIGAPPVIEKMPIGCKAARTIRGFTLFGGALGDTGSLLQLQSGTATLYYDPVPYVDAVNIRRDVVTMAHDAATTGGAIPFKGAEAQFGCAKGGVPVSYGGSGAALASKTLWPYPTKIVPLDKALNTNVGYGGTWTTSLKNRVPDVRFLTVSPVLEQDFQMTAAATQQQNTFLVLPQGRIHYSEPDVPSVVPATNTIIVSNEQGQDVEGIGDAGGQGVVCTRDRTYYLPFSAKPSSIPEVANASFGCIGANTMASVDGGCVWISDRGPVAMIGGAFSWIGEPLERWFCGASARYLRDSTGMMRHAFGCHDPQRGLVYFGLFRNRAAGTANELTVRNGGVTYTWGTASDGVKSRFACDEVLIYSYRVGAWSVWRPPAGIGVQWMTVGKDEAGLMRVFWLGSDRRLYVFDDSYGTFVRNPTATTVGAKTTSATFTVVAGAANRVGSTVAIIRTSATPHRLIAVREITSVPSTTSIVLDSEVAVLPGDTILVGVRSMTYASGYFTPKGLDAATINGARMHYDLWGQHSFDAAEPPHSVFVQASLRSRQWRESDSVLVTSTITDDESGDAGYSWAGYNLAGEPVATMDLALGLGQSHSSQFRMTAIGGSQIRIQNIAIEVQ